MEDNKANMSKLKIAVYCSASYNLPSEWVEAAAQVGHWIGSAGATLVYGGVDAGLMRVLAQSVKAGTNGRIIGVVPQLRSQMASPLNDVVIPTEGLSDRKANMQQMADVFVVLPGGYGTLDEMISALAYISFNRCDNKSIIIFNPDGLFDHILAQFDTMISRGLMSVSCLECMTVATSVEDIIAILNYKVTNFAK